MESIRSTLIHEVIQSYIWDNDRSCIYTADEIVPAIIHDELMDLEGIDTDTLKFCTRVINSTNEELIMISLAHALNRLNQL